MKKYRLTVEFKDKESFSIEGKCKSWRGACRWRENRLKKWPDWQGHTLKEIL